MSWFQIIAIAVAVVLGLRSLMKASRVTGRRARLLQLVFAGVWLFGALCLARPEMTTTLSKKLGIGRGADLLLYILALGSFWFAMFTYYRLSALSREITGIVRQLAIDDARRATFKQPDDSGGAMPAAPAAPGSAPDPGAKR